MKNSNTKTKLVARLMFVVVLVVGVLSLSGCKTNNSINLEGYFSVDDDDWRLIREITPNPNSDVKNAYEKDIPPAQLNLWSALESIACGDETFYLARILKNNFFISHSMRTD